MDNQIILVGAFGEMCELAEVCHKKIVGIIDNNHKDTFRDIPIIGTDDDAPMLITKYQNVPIVISPDKPQLRKKLVEYYQNIGFMFTELISPYANISPTAEIGLGCVIQSRCNISADTKIGKFCKLNSLCNIMHDNTIGDYTTVAPNAVLLGYVKTESCAYIGANSTVLPARKIGADSIVGAGSVVTKDVPIEKIVKGVPAK